jgi:hypothetical protein
MLGFLTAIYLTIKSTFLFSIFNKIEIELAKLKVRPNHILQHMLQEGCEHNGEEVFEFALIAITALIIISGERSILIINCHMHDGS